MIIKKYDIELHRLTADDIEMVRNWRNDPKVSQFMNFRDHITEEMQKKWFQSINNDNNYYFIIVIDNKKVGLTEIKKIDYENKSGESGIFIYDDSYQNSVYPFKIIFSLFDFAFYELKLEKIYAYILPENVRAVKFNESLGFSFIEKESSMGKYILTTDNYEKSVSKFKKIINKI
ncbi:MAG: hypothetical protein A2086_06060 [Spirochaetes bacterium GWD1_27_9]|nr:MAG: hypothetical protein A2Z98_10720 [Spirochaetes bacterium GWB1_27_13]OHD20354.1 MAG: hypothetical protein A2Y34_10295 [Spirochaetes bacterium GWC1_27_15]OHD35576.1 MAG: hypothetical protein A2086_06060 [Spirochaetes bacterium GWD1_27_9]